MKSININNVIQRLKRELNIKFDAELARQLGIERTYLGAMKSRGEFTGSAWNAILDLCDKKSIDVNYVVFGRSASPNSEDKFIANLIQRIVADQKSAEDLVAQVEEASQRYADDLPKEAYREELLKFAQKLIEAAL